MSKWYFQPAVLSYCRGFSPRKANYPHSIFTQIESLKCMYVWVSWCRSPSDAAFRRFRGVIACRTCRARQLTPFYFTFFGFPWQYSHFWVLSIIMWGIYCVMEESWVGRTQWNCWFFGGIIHAVVRNVSWHNFHPPLSRPYRWTQLFLWSWLLLLGIYFHVAQSLWIMKIATALLAHRRLRIVSIIHFKSNLSFLSFFSCLEDWNKLFTHTCRQSRFIWVLICGWAIVLVQQIS